MMMKRMTAALLASVCLPACALGETVFGGEVTADFAQAIARARRGQREDRRPDRRH